MPRVKKNNATEKEVFVKKRRSGGYFYKTISVVVNGKLYSTLCQIPNELHEIFGSLSSNVVYVEEDIDYSLARAAIEKYKTIIL